MEVLQLVARGWSCRRIAEHLGISRFTARKHRANLCRKLDCHSASQLSAVAVRVCESPLLHEPCPFDPEGTKQLQPREKQVIFLLAEGMTSKQIARKLGGISPRTVQKHRERAMRKLGIQNMTALMQAVSALKDSDKQK